MQKQLEGTQKYINECADGVAHIDGQLMQLLYNTRAQRSINYQSNKNRAIHLRMFAGFLF